MPVLPTSQVQAGDCLGSNVYTSYGGLLLQEGRTLSGRDLEILQAFLIPQVDIRRPGLPEIEEPEEEAAPPEPKLSPLHEAFRRLELLLLRTFRSISPGTKLPILELRTGMKDLIDEMERHDYHVLTFVPPPDVIREPLVRNSVLTAMTSYSLAKWAKLAEKDWLPVALAGLLHDIGNVRIDPAILKKPTKLTADELNEMRQHTIYGFRMLEGVPALNKGVALAALQHHERIDGSGYPMKQQGDKIHPYARIVAIADVYHAMTSNRGYRQAQSPYLVLEELQAESFGKLDPVLVQTFVEKLTSFHNGMLVRLSDKRIGEIVFTERNHPTRPMVSVDGQIINLSQKRELYIVEIFSA